VFLLWLSVTLLNVPCVLVWAHNYRWEEWDLVLYPDYIFSNEVDTHVFWVITYFRKKLSKFFCTFLEQHGALTLNN
jgi:hypothetical protein